MTFYDVWIGPAVDPWGLAGRPPAAPLDQPRRPSPVFPDGRTAFFELWRRIDSGALRGWRLDWGSWAALATRADVEALFAAICGPPGAYEARHAGELEHLAERLRALRAFVAELPGSGPFTLVGAEY